MSDTDSYSEVLEFAQEHLSEGAYLRVANALQESHKEGEPRVLKTTTSEYPINVQLHFKTLNEHEVVLEYKKLIVETTMYYGSTPSKKEKKLFGSRKGFNFEDSDIKRHVLYLGNIISSYGAKDIRRTHYIGEGESEDCIEDVYDTFGDFKKHVNKVQENLDPDNDDSSPFTLIFYILQLMGLSSEQRCDMDESATHMFS